MADETTPEFTPETLSNGEDNSPAIGLISQYVKDLSFENPNAPAIYQVQDAPQIDVQFNIGTEVIGTDVHEVTLKLTLTAASQRGTMYIVDLAYCGLVGMRNLSEEQAHAFLYAEAPRLLFPFARGVVSDAVRDAGFLPLLVDPVDFNGLYAQQLASRRAEEAAGGQPITPVTGNA